MRSITPSMSRKKSKTIDEYIGTFPSEVQKLLGIMRETIHAARSLMGW
jgi:hypothetical protein